MSKDDNEQILSIPPSTLVFSEEFGWGETFTGITGINEQTTIRFAHGRELITARKIIEELIPAAENHPDKDKQ
ncbi:hypothetical protein [Flocculibacter collagenilyticus]|uniref:hypothetical protein n=1 Tax=Flocculibacter collagenilyticus TaxID=2744479 RepID=UPI0018F27F9A|nr:hypothetical protein [Flocculibacter collagenilyticus]